jgi:hypothetical protein
MSAEASRGGANRPLPNPRLTRQGREPNRRAPAIASEAGLATIRPVEPGGAAGRAVVRLRLAGALLAAPQDLPIPSAFRSAGRAD